MIALKQYLMRQAPQHIGLSEPNLVWNKMDIYDRPYERFRTWSSRIKTSAEYIPLPPDMQYTCDSPHQFGGVLSITLDDGCSRWHDSGGDPSEMGRWTWTRFRGAQGKLIRIITAYRPNGPSSHAGSVFNQQRAAMVIKNDDRDPRVAFWEDLGNEIAKWMESELLVVGLDMNADVSARANRIPLERLGLIEVLTAKHQVTPNTYVNGTKTIDAIFTSRSMRHCRCGYLPFKDGFDHRATWIDISYELFGCTTGEEMVAKPQRLNHDPGTHKKYLLHQHLDRQHFSEAIETEYHKILDGATLADFDHDHLNNLYDEQFQRMEAAEAKCRKLRMGEQDWSPEFRQLRARRVCWTKILAKLNGSRVHTSTIARLMTKGRITQPLATITTAIATTELERVKKESTNYRRHHQEKRETFLQRLAERHAETGNATKEQVVLQQRQAEMQRRDGRILRKVRGKLKGSAFTSVLAPLPNGEWQECSTKDEIEAACLAENERRFNQATQTPFLQAPLLPLVGKFGLSEVCDRILDGTYVNPTLDYWTQSFISHLQRPPTYRPMRSGLELDDYQRLWKRAKLKSASPFGPRFQHLKVNSRDDDLILDDFRLNDLAYRSGFAPSRWKKGMNAMLLKKPNEYKVTRLRTILLFDSAFNSNTKEMGRSTLRHAESMTKSHSQMFPVTVSTPPRADCIPENNFPLAPEQYGSRKYHQAIDQCLNKRLTFDLSRQWKEPLAMAMTDLKSCYDRMVLSVISLALQRVATPTSAIHSMLATLHDFEHHCRTTFGDSIQSFSGKDWAVPIQGIGQGNGAGPTTWAFVSTPVLNMLRSHGCGAIVQTAISGTLFHLVGYSFVDDTDLLAFYPHSTMSIEQLIQRMQLSVDAWRGGMWATGGALVPEKSHWYLVDYVWKNGNWRYARIHEQEATISMLDADNANKEIARHEPDHAERTLGVRLAPDGNTKAEKAYLRKCAEEWAEQIKTGLLPRTLTWQALISTIMRKLLYPVLVTSFTRPEATYIVAPVIQVALSRSGICRTIDRAVVYGTHRYQGLNIPDLYVEQGIEKLACITKYMGLATAVTARLLTTVLENLRIEVGVNDNLFSLDYEQWNKVVTNTWAKSLWKFALEYDIIIEERVPALQLQRQNDRLLMECFVQNGISPDDLALVNRCRIFLQASTVSDISTGDGQRIRQTCWDGRRDENFQSQYKWPTTPTPPKAAWLKWQKALAGLCSRNRRLRTKLGSWYCSSAQFRWWYHAATESLWQVDSAHTNVFRCKQNRGTRNASMRFLRQSSRCPLPPEVMPCTVDDTGHTILFQGASDIVTPVPTPSPGTFLQFLQTHSEWAWLFQNTIITGDLAELIHDMQVNHCIAVSDGSFKDAHGTAAWRVGGPQDRSAHITGWSVTPGTTQEQGSYRSELHGTLASIIIIDLMMHYFKLRRATVDIVCDNKTVIQMLSYDKNSISPSQIQHFDLLSVCLRAKHADVEWSFTHVSGHVDSKFPNRILTLREQINVQMDHLAKQGWDETHTMSPAHRRQFIPKEPWPIVLGGQKICSDYKDKLRDWCQRPRILGYWTRTQRIRPTDIHKINFDAVLRAMKAASQTRRQWVSKHTSGVCGVKYWLKRWKQEDDDTCPRCGIHPETAQHVWYCQGLESAATWTAALQKLKQHMVKLNTDPFIMTTVISRLRTWQDRSPAAAISPHSREHIHALEEQDEIGWENFFMGFTSHRWQNIQQAHLNRIGSRKTSERWISALIQKQWDVAWDVWEYRNQVVHDQKLEEAKLTALNMIRSEFDTGHDNIIALRPLFRRTRYQMEQSDLAAQLRWLHAVTSIRAREARKPSNTSVARMRQFMDSYFQVAPP